LVKINKLYKEKRPELCGRPVFFGCEAKLWPGAAEKSDGGEADAYEP
jgi:hypothetical protein